MKNTYRFLSSLVSSLLISAGLSRAAALFDPLSHLAVRPGQAESMAVSCIMPCALAHP